MTNAPKTETATVKTAAESKADKFKRLAVVRMNKVIEFLDKMESLSNKNIYEYTPEQVEKVIGTLEARVLRLKNALNNGKVQQGGFDL